MRTHVRATLRHLRQHGCGRVQVLPVSALHACRMIRPEVKTCLDEIEAAHVSLLRRTADGGKVLRAWIRFQKQVLKEIHDDMKKPIMMNRLLQGDVGCGKTIVAILASAIAVGNILFISILRFP